VLSRFSIYIQIPEVYIDQATWASKTNQQPPLMLMNTLKQRAIKWPYPLKDVYEQLPSPAGTFLFKLTISFANLSSTFIPQQTSTSKKNAQHNAALMLLLQPPTWIMDLTQRGVLPEGLSVEGLPPPKNVPTPKVTPTVTTPKPTAPAVEPTENDLDDIIDVDVMQRPQCTTDVEISFDRFWAQQLETPSRFLDFFGDGSLVIQNLDNDTGRYPDTDAMLVVEYIMIAQSSGKVIEEHTARRVKINELDLVPLFYPVLALLRVGGQLLAFSTHLHGYGKEGIPNHNIEPNESLLVWVRLKSAEPFKKGVQETQDDTLPLAARLRRSRNYQISGIGYYKRKIYKLALDECIRGIRLLAPDDRKRKTYSLAEKDALSSVQASLYLQVALVYKHWEDWKKVQQYTDKAIACYPRCTRAYLVNARVYIFQQKFDEAIANINRAKLQIFGDEVTVEEQTAFVAELNKVKDTLQKKIDDYEKASRKMETLMAQAFVGGGSD